MTLVNCMFLQLQFKCSVSFFCNGEYCHYVTIIHIHLYTCIFSYNRMRRNKFLYHKHLIPRQRVLFLTIDMRRHGDRKEKKIFLLVFLVWENLCKRRKKNPHFLYHYYHFFWQCVNILLTISWADYLGPFNRG